MAEKLNEEQKSSIISTDSLPEVDFSCLDKGHCIPRLVTKGLQLKQESQKIPFRAIDYAPAIIYNPEMVHKDWCLLSLQHVEDEHIEIHFLSEDDDLLQFAEECRRNHAKAMIVINNAENYTLAPELTKPLQTLESFLVAILPLSEGSSLLECLKVQFANKKFFAKLDTVSSENVLTTLEENYDVVEEDEINDCSLVSRHKGLFDLKTKTDVLMFNGEELHLISTEGGRFTMIMANFSYYERMGKPNPYEVNEIIKTLCSCIERSMLHEFPFFLVLSYRFRKFSKFYNCEKLVPFTRRCIELFEKLCPSQVANVLKSFLEKKDFDIMFAQEEANSSVFTLLATASQEFMNISCQIKCDSSKTPGSNGILYCQFLWISVYLKCLGEKGLLTSDMLSIWKKSLLKTSGNTPVTKQIVQDIKLGIEVSTLLDLPNECQFTTHHLSQFLASEKLIRPLSHVRDVIANLEEFLKTEKELLFNILRNLRFRYAGVLKSSKKKFVKHASTEQTVLGVTKEGISFLDCIREIWHKKKWDRGELHKDFKDECLAWVKFLFEIVCIANPDAPQLLKNFLVPKEGSVVADKDIKERIIKLILEEAKKRISELNIAVYLPLFEEYEIWPLSFIGVFLEKYRISNDFRINDPEWSDFLSIILKRFQKSDEAQNYMFNFLIRVAVVYKMTKRALDFILDVLQLKVPYLFSTATETKVFSKNALGKEFSDHLKRYILSNSLQPKLMNSIQEVYEHIPEDDQTELQWIILSVIKSEVIPEMRHLLAGKGQSNKKSEELLKLSVNTLCKKESWFDQDLLSPKEKFCWGIIAAVCDKIPITNESFEWVSNLKHILQHLKTLFTTYCSSRTLTDEMCLLTEMPPEIINCHVNDVKDYFHWVQSFQNVLICWQNKFSQEKINYDDIMMYACNNISIDTLGQTVCAATCILDLQHIREKKEKFNSCFEKLNCYLLLYIPDHPEAKYCTLLELLLCYGVSLPSELLREIQQKVYFPGKKVPEEQRLKSTIPPSLKGNFNPGQDISVMVTKSLSLGGLKKMVEDLDDFHKPITDNMKMFIFFHLYKSEMFKNHLLKCFEDIKTTPSPSKEDRSMSRQFFGMQASLVSVWPGINPGQEEGISVQVLQESLNGVKDLFLKMLNGTATYSDIVANGTLQLETLNLEEEFATLMEFARLLKMRQEECNGLEGVKCILELFQFTHHINQIKQACEQYGLKQCLIDKKLEEMLLIVNKLKTEKSRALLTSIEAKAKMDFIKESLCLQQCTDLKCLKLFSAVTDSADFYKFIKDKQFTGSEGQAIFYEQYQLITAQLQHEEYDENVLNHLRVAYKLVAPFMDSEINFCDLMNKVIELNATDHGIKQLETVNENIMLIKLWFLRSEGDTIENVAEDLQYILNTGEYHFQLNGDSSIVLIYQTYRLPLKKEVIKDYALEQPEEESNSSKEMSTHPSATTTEVEKLPVLCLTGRVEQKWDSKQIVDFVRRLGFLDTTGNKKASEMVKHFLHLNSTANELLELFTKLFKLGHSEYQRNAKLPVLHCNITKEEANFMVTETQQTLLKWQGHVEDFHHQYRWLLFFPVPKALHLYSLLKDVKVDSVTLGISFLFKNDRETRNMLTSVVKEGIEKARETNVNHKPMEVLGMFLQFVCESEELKSFLCKKRSLCHRPKDTVHTSCVSTWHTSMTLSVFPFGTYLLHYTPGYSQSQLIRLICVLYNGVPECYEVFHCRPSTTQEELCLFMKRIRYHPSTYLVLQVNRLPFHLQELLMTLLKQVKIPDSFKTNLNVTVHFVETSPSVLREFPWITFQEHKHDGPKLSFDEASQIYRKAILYPEGVDFRCIQLVYGYAGDGKTHYIKDEIEKNTKKNEIEKNTEKENENVIITVNEAFTPIYAIKKLNMLSHTITGCTVFFNFTLMLSRKSLDQAEESKFSELIETIEWFFYDFLVLGYVEDLISGDSFRFPGGQKWHIYIEVPSLGQRPEESLQLFNEEFPTLGLLGSSRFISPSIPITVDADVQLVCKYLKAYKIGGVNGIDRLYKEPKKKKPIWKSRPPLKDCKKVKFSEDPNLSDDECHQLLMKYMPEHIKEAKITQMLFIRYMKRRCAFLDDLPAFNYNFGTGEVTIDKESGEKAITRTHKLGSTLMKIMLEEVSNFCDPFMKKNWSEKSHQQLIYDFRDGGGSFGFLSLRPENMPENELEEYKMIGFELHRLNELQQREILDQMLARALGLPSNAEKCLSIINDCNYVLTLDYTIKMLNIHERYCCGVPVIIQGETGVGKTALMEMLSRLWSNALLYQWYRKKGTIIDAIRDLMSIRIEDSLENYQTCLEITEAIIEGKEVSLDDLMVLGQLDDRDSSKGPFCHRLQELLLDMEKDPAIALLEIPSSTEEEFFSFARMFESTRKDNSIKTTVKLLQAVLKAEVKNTFHKLNVHGALTVTNIKNFFEPIIQQAELLKAAYENAQEEERMKTKMPFVTVFLDEVNTSSCLGLLKEIIIDRTIEGMVIPDNVFIVAACNPHRGNSMATHANETWLRSSYYVRPLHPTLECLMWDYGSLDQHQEREYVIAKMKMIHKQLPNIEVVDLTDPIVESQCLMRKYSVIQLKEQNMNPLEAELSSKSCVSQRDIQRVFTFYQWLMSVYSKLERHNSNEEYRKQCAVIVSLGIVYYMRLNRKYRQKYEEELNKMLNLREVQFSETFNKELDFFCESIELPAGIARTQALKENLFATIICTVNHVPLVIVGVPGSSKTLSFKLAISNLKGPESKMPLFRDTRIFKSLDPYFYQCSRRTTSKEVETVFSRAINRQRNHAQFFLPIYCVVFMDEAGLPEESHESLKVLHYHLDKQEVSFVAITNHVLDASKTNRAVSLFRPEASQEDLEILAKGCFTSDPNNPPKNFEQDLKTIVKFCPAYSKLMEDSKLKCFFGLRDFIHFINFLRRRRMEGITPQLVVEALERNFNGICWAKDHKEVCEYFLKTISSQVEKNLTAIQWRSALEVFRESLEDHPEGGRDENEVRYKLMIDPTEDNSLMRLLIAYGVLDREKTRIYMCSDFPRNNQMQKMNTISAIRHSAIEGHTVILSQTDDIHESFYDLFNQRFRKINNPNPELSPLYYANIAIGAHLKPCRVHPNFSCIVVVKQAEVETTPAPFLNRFEKYYISHETLLDAVLSHLWPCLRIILQTAREKVNEFINIVAKDNNNIYGLKPQTLDSLFLSLLPHYNYEYQVTNPDTPISNDVRVCLLYEMLRALRKTAGFAIPAYPINELIMDAEHLFLLASKDAMFEGALESVTIDSVNDVVNEAMCVLHRAPNPQEEYSVSGDISPEAYLVVFLLQQWFIRHLCKTLMQLMTPEAFCLHRKKIPTSLIDNYLTNQQHFSLKKLIEHHIQALNESCQNNTYPCPNKLLCFTRSSSSIYQLPFTYPHTINSILKDEEAILKELVFDDPTKVKICQISSVQSQAAIQEMLKEFIQESQQALFLLMVNTQEATTEMVNHLRVIIEETEAQTQSKARKLFVLLLHFSSIMFFNPCYPSLFLQGWNHYYLDSIGHTCGLHSGKLDIEEWLQRCCLSNKDFERDNLLEACHHLLNDLVPSLISHITCNTRSSGPFSSDMNVAERKETLHELLFVNGKKVGQKLCQMFRACWYPNEMTEYIEQAARFAQSRESSLNITDAVQTMFHSLFTDFMVVKLNEIISNCDLDVLLSQDDSYSEVKGLFFSLLEITKPPKLDQLKALARGSTQQKAQEYQPMFPFFSIVNKCMEQLMEDSRKTISYRDNPLKEHSEEETPTASYFVGNSVDMRELVEVMILEAQKRLNKECGSPPDPLCIALKYIMDFPEKLWERYFSDFIHHFLHLDIVSSTLTREMINAFFSDFFELPPLERVVYLHIYVESNRISLSNMCSLLNPLEQIWKVSTGSQYSSSSANEFIEVVKKTKHPFGDPQMMSSFVISALFSTLVGTRFSQDEKNQEIKSKMLEKWYRTYHSVMSMPALKSHLYMSSLSENEEAKFNVMHTTFALMHTYHQLDKDALDKGSSLFTILLDKYFNDTTLQLKNNGVVPSLADCSQRTEELIFKGRIDSVTQSLAQTFQEELFNHFFSPNKTSYSSQDRKWFLENANKCQNAWNTTIQVGNQSYVTEEHLQGILSTVALGTYKRHLSLLLGSSSSTDTIVDHSGSGPLMMYDAKARQDVAEVVSQSKSTGQPCPYIPFFYQNQQDSIKPPHNSMNSVMQQPLCHLYFINLMEDLMTQPRNITSLVKIAFTISQLLRPESLPLGDKIILQIEKQAVIQCLLQQLASLISESTSQASPNVKLAHIMNDLNDLLEDESTGGGATRGHGLTLGMHLLSMLQSYRKFTDLFTKRYPTIRDLYCTRFIHDQLRDQTESKSYLFSFMCLEDQTSTLSKLYQQVKFAMIGIDGTNGSQAHIELLVNIANECNCLINAEQHDSANGRQPFQMLLWLVTYYEFFAKMKSSTILCNVVGQQLKHHIKDILVVQLIQCFLDPGCLIERKEPSIMAQPLGHCETARDGCKEEKADPLYALFKPNPQSTRDQSDNDLCYCLANLIGVILGCSPRSNHFWYHLFSPDELKDTYMTGFMYDAKVSPEGLLYDYGVELTPDGQYGHHDYIPHATRGTYSLRSLYFLLWANFGTFCVSLLTQPDAQSKIHGVLISKWRSIRHYCISQLKALWRNLRNNLSLSDEERSFLVTRCLFNVYETNMKSSAIGSHQGTFNVREELNQYETFWHENVFLPACQELTEKFADSQQKIFTTLRNLERYYPQFPGEKDLLNYVQSLIIEDDSLRLLVRFILERQRLEVGGQLLPILVEFYQWLHTFLAHLVTSKRAHRKVTIGRVIQLASKRVSSSLSTFYQSVKDCYNDYVKLVGKVGQKSCSTIKQTNQILTIEDNLPLIHFLSESEEEGLGGDCLFTIIRDIADMHNQFISTLYDNVHSMEKQGHPLAHLLPREPPRIYVTEVNEYNCLVGKQKQHHGLSEFLQLVRARLDPFAGNSVVQSHTDRQTLPFIKVPPYPSLSLDLIHFQEDIVNSYFSGKPIIQDISSIRTVFKFKEAKKDSGIRDLHADLLVATSDITVLSDDLPEEYQVPLEADHSHQLEYEFHSANYHTLKVIVIGLQTAVQLLVKALKQEEEVSSQDTCLGELSLAEFIQKQYESEEDSQCQMMSWIGVKDISDAHLCCIASTKVFLLFSTLELFILWLKDGLYDFSSLPLALKVQLSEKDSTTLEDISNKFSGTPSDLLAGLKRLVEVLLHREPYLVKEINRVAQKPLTEVLSTLSLSSDLESLLKLIPNTVLVHHYVKLRMFLRKLIAIVEQKVTAEKSLLDASDQKQWNEMVADLWTKVLPHSDRDKGIAFIDHTLPVNSVTGRYGFYADWEDEKDNEFDEDLNEDTSEDRSLSPFAIDSDDLPPDQSLMNHRVGIENTSVECSSGTQEIEGPQIQVEASNVIIKEEDIEQQARLWSSQKVSQFLQGLGMMNHAEKFLEADIDGAELLNAERDVYEDQGVTSSVEYAKIAVQFKRELMDVKAIYCSVEEFIESSRKLTSFKQSITVAGVDVDMLKFAQENDFLDELLCEIGIENATKRNRIKTALKTIQVSHCYFTR